MLQNQSTGQFSESGQRELNSSPARGASWAQPSLPTSS